ncbi:MAG: Trehalose/maltose import ATP-binding protein MalK [Methanoregula sp. PtaU1.Bin051]|nr:MAG: Trehalose/maltose import ATP-binding protein MalK [Methanoregula sp. PtaU1.Bin051]
MIEITGLRHRTLTINHLTITPGRTFLIGPNGSGKTTLLRLISGIDEPESGTIIIDGNVPRMVETGWVNEYPDRNILFSQVYDEIAAAPRFAHLSCPDTETQVLDLSFRIGLKHILRRNVRDLSGGEKVLVAIAAAIISRPALLVLDEYDSHLDPESCHQIDTILRSGEMRYIIGCTQHMDIAATGDHVIALERGRVAYTGSPSEVFRHYENTAFYPNSWRITQ